MRRSLRSMALAWGGAAACVAAVTPDYAREERWAREVEPAIVVGEPVYLATPERPRVLAIYVEVASPKGGVVILHGIGVHPDWGLIGGLRTGLAEAGFSTLSVQMPVLAADASRDDYIGLFPEAGERIAAAVEFFRRRGIARVALVAHSMGAAMSDDYLASPWSPKIVAWAPIGMSVDFAAPPREPVLDVTAANDLPAVRDTAPLRAARLPRDGCSRHAVIADTDHYMEHRQKELVGAISPFLARAFAGACRRESGRGK